MNTTNRVEHPPKAGFTLIELLIVVGITALVMITVSTVFISFMVSSSRTEVRKQVSSEGNEAIRQIEFEIRNARKVAGSCSGTSSSITLETSGDDITISVDSNNLLEISQGAIDKKITSETSVSDLEFTCSETSGVQSVQTSIDLFPTGTSFTPTEFKTTTQVRNTSFN